MTNTLRAYARRRSASSNQQGKRGSGIMKWRRRRNLYDGKKFIDNMVPLSPRRKPRSRKKASNNIKAGQIRKSSRLIDKGYTNRFYEAEGGLEIIKAPYGNGIMHGGKPNDDDEEDDDLAVDDADNEDEDDADDDVVDDDVSDDNDDDDDGDHYTYNNYHHDGDWMPKSSRRNWVHHNDDDYHNHEICSAHVCDGLRTTNVDVNNGNDETHHHHRNNCFSNPDIDNANNEVHHHIGHGTPNANADSGYDGTNQQNDYDMTLAQSHDDNAHNDYQIPSDCDNMPPNVVAYCRRKRRTIGGILKDCDYAISQRQSARCWSKKRAFPSWICKKPRVFRRQQDKRCHGITIMTNGHCESNTTVQHHSNHNNSMHMRQMWEHNRNQTSHSMAASQLQEDSQSPPTTLTPLQSNSSEVALATVLEALGSADSELTRSLHVHSTDATLRLHMTHGAKIPSPQVTKEVGKENCTENVKNEAPKVPTQKPKRKKHRPKVQRDIFHKARGMAKDTKIKVGEQRGDGLQRHKPRAKKGQVDGELTGKPSMRISKKRSHMQGGALSADDSDTLKDENVGSNCLCGINKENSLIPAQSTVLQKVSNEFRENNWSQNLTVSEVPYSCNMLTPLVSGEQPGKGELTMCTHMMEGQITLNLEIIKWIQGNKLALYGQFFRQQSQPFINESRLPLHFESTTMGTHALSLVQLKPEDSTPLLLAEEPHNQLEMVVYDQKREMVVSKSAKLRTKIRAKVQLDVEHERIWPLLVLGGIPTDFEDIHYWNKERELMKRRVEVFIHKMQSVQGDRHFSPWKGSILDSVVGAFLTQNVSDHLSSSAFMSVASCYPSKQRNGAENTCNSVSDGANTENKCALETSGISCEVRSDMQDRYKISSGLVHEEFLHKQGNFHLPDLEDHGSTTSTCETSLECAEFSKHIRPSSSLHAVKTVLRNKEALQPIGTRNIENQSNLSTPIITATRKGCVLPDEDCTRQTGMPDMVRAFPNLKEGKILTKEGDISISSLSDHQSVTINHAVQSDMKHLEIVPPQLIEENTPMNQSDISMSHHTSKVVDYTAQSCMQHLETDPPCLMEEDISMKPNDISISSVSHHNGKAVNYTWQSGMQHLESSSSLIGEEDISTKASEISSSIISHPTGLTVDYRGQSGTQHLERASTSLMEENISTKPSDISNSSLGHHNNTGQSGMKHLERDSHPLLVGKNNSMTPCISHNYSIRADHTGESSMQRASTCLMEEDFSRKSKDISISCLGHQNCIMIDDCRGHCGTQHLMKALPHLTEEEISMEQCNHSSSSSSYLDSMTVKHNLYDINYGCAELLDKEKNCSYMCSNEVSCKHPSVSSPLEPRELVGNSNTNTAIQEVRASIDQHHAVNQCTMDNEGWQCPGRRTKVYQNSTVCRSLFKDDVPEQINVKATTLLNTHIEEHRLNNSNPAHHPDAHLTMIQKSKQVDCGSGIVQSAVAPFPSVSNNALSGNFINESKQVDRGSDLVHSALAPSPSLKIVGNKRRPSLSGIERAHLEENQNGRKRNQTQDWELIRKRTLELCSINENTCVENVREDTHCDSVDWDAVRRASVEELAETIKERGMHHVLSGRIKAFLKTLQEEQGNLDLEWLRKVSPENAKAYLMGIRGLGVKSVECIRLLSLHHVAFPVDVNVGRICVRLGWVPIEPLPEQLQLHLLELYPVQETIQKYLWPRLVTLDQKTLYELHYQLITFGKVFCTKSKPNCNACPMRTECKHFASAYASAKLLLTGSNEPPLKSLCSGKPVYALTSSSMDIEESTIVDNEEQNFTRCPQISEIDCNTTDCFSNCQQFYIEEPASPEETPEIEISDIEDFPCFYGSLNDFTEDLLKAGNFSESPYVSMEGHSSYIKENNRKCYVHTCSTDAGVDASCKCLTTKGSSFNIEGEKSTADGGGQYTTDRTTPSASTSCFGDSSSDFSHGEGKSTDNCGGQYTTDGTTPSASTFCFGNPSSQEIFSSCESIFVQEESDVSEEATNALVSLPEGAHIPAPKLKNIDRLRTIHYVYELPDTHPLLEQAEVREKDDPSLYLLAIWSPGEAPHSQQEIDEIRQEDLCKFYGASANETVSGTLLIPCRTAMRGSFPLNGTYFQVNEVFADHASSLRPFQVPRSHIWRLQRRFVYFGTSVSNIFRGLTSDEIKSCFLRGHVCVRGFDREKRTPKPLVCRLHFPISKQIQQRHKKDKTEASHTH